VVIIFFQVFLKKYFISFQLDSFTVSG